MKEYNNNEKKSRGYIKLYRKIIDSEIWDKSPSYLKLWVWMLCKAKFKDGDIARGQLKTSITEMQTMLAYEDGNRMVFPGKRTIYRILKFLKQKKAIKTQQIMRKRSQYQKGEPTMLITILNYEKYQESQGWQSKNGINAGSQKQNVNTEQNKQNKQQKQSGWQSKNNGTFRNTNKKVGGSQKTQVEAVKKQKVTIGENKQNNCQKRGGWQSKNAVGGSQGGSQKVLKPLLDGQVRPPKNDYKNDIYIHKEANNSICTHQQRLKFDFGSPYCDIRKGEKQLHISQILSALLQKRKHSNTQKHKGGGLDEETRRNKLIEDFNQYLKQKGMINDGSNSMSKPEKQ